MSAQRMPVVTVYHYVGYAGDGDGISTQLRALAQESELQHVALYGADYRSKHSQPSRLRVLRLSPRAPEGNLSGRVPLLRCFLSALALRGKLAGRSDRRFVGQSRAGNIIALCLHLLGCGRNAWAHVHTCGARRGLYRLMHRVMGSHLICLTPGMRSYYGLPVDPADPWRACVPPAIPSLPLTATAAPLRNGDGEVVVGGIGQIVRWKGWDIVLGALERLPDGAPVRFRHIGTPGPARDDAEFADALARRVSQSPRLRQRVRFEGWCGDVAQFLGEVSCLIVPSLAFEGTSNAAIEALRAGRRVIVSDACVLVAPLVAACGAGWSYPARDAHALAALLGSLPTRTGAPPVLDLTPLQGFSAPAAAARWDALLSPRGAGMTS